MEQKIGSQFNHVLLQRRSSRQRLEASMIRLSGLAVACVHMVTTFGSSRVVASIS